MDREQRQREHAPAATATTTAATPFPAVGEHHCVCCRPRCSGTCRGDPTAGTSPAGNGDAPAAATAAATAASDASAVCPVRFGRAVCFVCSGRAVCS
ncbi:MAG: hypothetical protein WBP59_07740, partial [Ilumatobacteraceae bacterium]